ncbi:MAG: hypothetical protein N2746_05895 [Deltaproteobacteria bacterium]|nr:hypothetical protein [Deltaproteobacteria bacterium]
MNKNMTNSIFTALLIVLVLFSCTKEESPTPLPPPVKPVVEQMGGTPSRTTISEKNLILAKEIRAKDYQTGEATGQSDCGSVCKKVNDCLRNRASSVLAVYCEQKCPQFPEQMKNGIASLTDCGKIAYNYHKFNCENTCNLITKSNNNSMPKELGGNVESCVAECMVGINTAEKLINTANCFISKNTAETIQECANLAKDTKPASKVEDLLK